MTCKWFLGLLAAAVIVWPGMLRAQDHWTSPSTIGPYQSTVPSDWNSPPPTGTTGWNQTPTFRSQEFTTPNSQPVRFRQDGAPDYPAAGGSSHDGASHHGFHGAAGPGGQVGPAPGSHPWDSGGVGASSGGHRDANWIAGVNGLAFARDYEDDVGLSTNFLGESLFSTDADLGYFGGVEVFLGRRTARGTGWEARYWGLYPTRAEDVIGTLPVTNLVGFADVAYTPSGTSVHNIYNSADAHGIYRENVFHNVELNLLRNGGTVQGWFGRTINYELLAGFRWFHFHEWFRYSAFNSAPGLPVQFNYCNIVDNNLLGLQLGFRTERCVTQRLSLSNGLRFGFYQNRIRAEECLGAVGGELARIGTGPYFDEEYEFVTRKTDYAFLGELDLGFLYQVSPCARFSFGYRAIGVGGVALAPDQIPRNFADVLEIGRINSNGSLILHGAYGGLQFCF